MPPIAGGSLDQSSSDVKHLTSYLLPIFSSPTSPALLITVVSSNPTDGLITSQQLPVMDF